MSHLSTLNCTWSVSQELVGVFCPIGNCFTREKANVEVCGASDNKAFSIIPNDGPLICAKSSVRKL